jgi:hypothetical protein
VRPVYLASDRMNATVEQAEGDDIVAVVDHA